MNINVRRSNPLTDRELYNFDCTGLIKLPGLLDEHSTELCKNEILAGPGRIMAGRGDKTRYDELTKRSGLLAELAEDPRILKCVDPFDQPAV